MIRNCLGPARKIGHKTGGRYPTASDPPQAYLNLLTAWLSFRRSAISALGLLSPVNGLPVMAPVNRDLDVVKTHNMNGNNPHSVQWQTKARVEGDKRRWSGSLYLDILFWQ